MDRNFGVRLADDLFHPDLEQMWKALNRHHAGRSAVFGDHYASRSFADRCAELAAKQGSLRIAILHELDHACGYCISSVSTDSVAEIDSLYVGESVRGNGAGRILMEDALAWFDSMKAKKTILSVYDGNDTAGEFYRKFGFCPKFTVYEKISGGIS